MCGQVGLSPLYGELAIDAPDRLCYSLLRKTRSPLKAVLICWLLCWSTQTTVAGSGPVMRYAHFRVGDTPDGFRSSGVPFKRGGHAPPLHQARDGQDLGA